MLTKGDEYPIHQTAEPVAYSGTDPNFYDRYFFNGYGPDGSGFLALAFGVYPHLDIADAHFAHIRGGVQHNLHCSRTIAMERLELEVGPIRIEVLEPLRRLRVTVGETDGIAAQLKAEGRAFPIEEPRFTYRIGPRSFMDYTRLTQNVRWSGWIEVDGVRHDVADGAVGSRDRSWGVRPVGETDFATAVPDHVFQFFWLWTPLNFADRSVFFHVNADRDGQPWNTRAVLCPDGAAQGGAVEVADARADIDFQPGSRYPRAATLEINPPGASPMQIAFEPVERFQMRGVGYNSHPKWAHGRYVGQLATEREDIVLADVDPASPLEQHVQTITRATLEQDGAEPEQGVGIFESLIVGPYEPYGFVDFCGPGQ